MITTECGFTIAHYRDTLEAFRRAGYEVISFERYLREFSDAEKVLILRHDIDMRLDTAVRMARHDMEMGRVSTFFIRLHAKGYNFMDLTGYRAAKSIVAMGHELALHFESNFAVVLGEEPQDFASREMTIFEKIIGGPILGVSTHEPSRADAPNVVEDLMRTRGLKYHAYQDRFIKEMKYLSDSGGRWREGCFCNWTDKVMKLQVLIHPFWWYDTAPQENY